MKVLDKRIIKDGTKIQIEDWSEDYSFYKYGYTLASYPESKRTHKGQFAPKEGKIYRFDFKFNSFQEVQQAFNELLEGIKTLADFKENLSRKEYQNCI
jgi:alpha-galactosidase/6-phospho-beta-glucosidase family protein